jgi:NAD(P)-dependent dehydrogenase (short-subunit alcohol dehydrogenase family)
MGRLSGKIAVVTGGASGIGQAFARRLAQDGANVAVADLKAADETKRMVEGAGAKFVGVKCDVTKPKEIEAFAAEVKKGLGVAEILINNVGIFPLQAFEEMSFDDWRTINAINVDSLFLFSKAFVPGMKAARYGRIVNMTSTVNWLKIDNYVHYITTKAASIGFTRGLANELGQFGITVNAIAPSLVRNATTEASPLAGMFEAIPTMQAIPRLQVPDDLVGAMSFFVSEDAAFVTGQTLAVDGGLTKN